MENHLLSSIKRAVKNWWVSLLVGIIAVLLGTWCLFTPLTTFVALTLIFVICFFIGGISEIVFAVSNRNVLRNWGWSLAMGIIDFIFAIVLLSNMEIAPILFCYLIAFWILIQSIWAVGMSLDLQQYKGIGWGWLLALSILGILFALVLLFQPAIAGLFAAYIIAFSFLSYGIFRIYLAFRLKSLHKYLPKEDNK